MSDKIASTSTRIAALDSPLPKSNRFSILISMVVFACIAPLPIDQTLKLLGYLPRETWNGAHHRQVHDRGRVVLNKKATRRYANSAESPSKRAASVPLSPTAHCTATPFQRGTARRPRRPGTKRRPGVVSLAEPSSRDHGCLCFPGPHSTASSYSESAGTIRTAEGFLKRSRPRSASDKVARRRGR